MVCKVYFRLLLITFNLRSTLFSKTSLLLSNIFFGWHLGNADVILNLR